MTNPAPSSSGERTQEKQAAGVWPGTAAGATYSGWAKAPEKSCRRQCRQCRSAALTCPEAPSHAAQPRVARQHRLLLGAATVRGKTQTKGTPSKVPHIHRQHRFKTLQGRICCWAEQWLRGNRASRRNGPPVSRVRTLSQASPVLHRVHIPTGQEASGLEGAQH